MTNYEQELIAQCEERAALLVHHLKQTGDMLQEDAEVVDQTREKELGAKEIAEQDAKEIATALRQVTSGNKGRRFMLLYIVFAYLVVSQVCRFL